MMNFISFLHSPNKWESIISLDYLIKAEKRDIILSLDWEKVPNSTGNCELVQRISEKNNLNIDDIPSERFKLEGYELGMYSTLEKTIILKSVDLFKSIPAENLSRVAQITEEVRCDDGESIISEGEFGDSLFIVVNGNVKIHKGEKEITQMGEGSCIGDMALLDGEPRSADVTATEETTLFKIEQEGFYEVMGGHSDIMEAIIKNLSGRVRNMNEQLYSK
jgi:cAMP-binding proteins - catabolite gene activator and regulatory subunit of cAMP-dependent protein kinases